MGKAPKEDLPQACFVVVEWGRREEEKFAGASGRGVHRRVGSFFHASLVCGSFGLQA